ncbi:MAG: hypothetical protein ACKPKO_28285, partial [Candidatus Fonsibacter sp.]
MDEAGLHNFIYGTNPFYNYLGLINVKNHLAEDNLKSEKHLEKTEVVIARCVRLVQVLQHVPGHDPSA